jgi:signal peptidase I
MEPLFHKGDLALVRPAGSYRVHDIVLYESPILHRPVLHRIIAIQNGRYFFKGDHNDFIDPGYATRADLLGRLWVHIPNAGKALSFVGAPSHAGAIAGAAGLFLLLGGVRRTRRLRARRRGPRAVKFAIRHIHKPRHPVEELATLALLAVAALVLAVGFTTPKTRAITLANAYQNMGTFSYTARILHPSVSFPGGVISTGQPIFLSQAKTVDLEFRYSFSSNFPHGVNGTIGMVAELSSEASTWHQRYVIAKTHPFTGDAATLRVKLSLTSLIAIMGQLAVAAGNPADSYDAVLFPVVHVHGYVDDKPVNTTFSPQLPFIANKTFVKLDAQATGPVVGATRAPPSRASLIDSSLNPTASGSIPGIGPRAVTIAGRRISVVALRGLGIGLGALLLVVLLTRPLRRRRETLSVEQRLASRAGCVIVDVVSVVAGGVFTDVPIELSDFASLTGFARYLERPILRDLDTGAFAVEDGGRLYVWRPAAKPVAATAPPLMVAPMPARKRKRRPLRWIGAALSIAIVTSLAAALTEANVVPLSNAGVSTQPLNVNQLAPAECAALNLTHLLVAAGNTTTGPNGGALILGHGGVGTFTINGGTGNDCIVAGGGTGTKNTLNGGGGSDVCIGARGATNTFKNCEAKY